MTTTNTTQEWRIGDCIELMRGLDDECIDTIITSPPYWGLRDYGVVGQIGLEPTLEEYHERLLEVTAECMRVLKPTGVMFLNHGDSYYAGGGKAVEQSFKRQTAIDTGAYPDHAPAAQFRSTMGKCLTMQNERLIIRMIDEQGWILRNRIIWHKSNGMPSSVIDRFSNKYEPIYMLTKSRRYWFDLDAVRVPAKYAEVWSRKGSGEDTPYNQNNPRKRWGLTKHEIATQRMSGSYSDPLHQKPIHPSGMKNPGDVWTIPTQPTPFAHFATFPTALIEPMIKAACPAEICPVCGLARERITESEVEFTSGSGKAGNPPKGKHEGSVQSESGMCDIRMGPKVTYHTVGWTSCDCGAGWIAGTVLDPFCGSGTVLEVCRKLNRNAIGFELNPEYEPLIRERSMAHTPPLTSYFGDEQ